MLRDMTAVKTRFLLMTVTVIPSWESWLARARLRVHWAFGIPPRPLFAEGGRFRQKLGRVRAPERFRMSGMAPDCAAVSPVTGLSGMELHPPTAYPLQPPIIHR